MFRKLDNNGHIRLRVLSSTLEEKKKKELKDNLWLGLYSYGLGLLLLLLFLFAMFYFVVPYLTHCTSNCSKLIF